MWNWAEKQDVVGTDGKSKIEKEWNSAGSFHDKGLNWILGCCVYHDNGARRVALQKYCCFFHTGRQFLSWSEYNWCVSWIDCFLPRKLRRSHLGLPIAGQLSDHSRMRASFIQIRSRNEQNSKDSNYTVLSKTCVNNQLQEENTSLQLLRKALLAFSLKQLTVSAISFLVLWHL